MVYSSRKVIEGPNHAIEKKWVLVILIGSRHFKELVLEIHFEPGVFFCVYFNLTPS
jgi:hypothetical protein